MNDEQRAQLREQYLTMMDLSAWKHFAQEVDAIAESATKDEDAMSAHDLNLAVIGECRGMRKAINMIKTRLDYIVNGLN